MLIALGLSIIFSLVVGIAAARSKAAESVFIPILDVLQSIPILGFFPVVILAIISVFPSQLGVNIAVILLIFTSMSWNIAFGVYEAVKSIPHEYLELASMAKSSAWSRITSLYVPASLSRIAYNTQTSWAVGLFYLVASEILTLGNSTYTVDHGIGVALINFATAQDWASYTYAIIALIIAVVIWRFVFLREFALWSEHYKFVEEPRSVHVDPLMRFYSWVNQKSISKLFLIAHGRGVNRFTSVLQKYRRTVKYSILGIILSLVILFFYNELAITLSRGGVVLPHIYLSTLIAVEIPVLVALAYSFFRIWYIYMICVVVGLPLGIVISLKMKLYDTVSPVLEVISSIPAPALLPLIILVAYGSGEVVAAIVIFIAMIWYVIFNVMAGVRTLPADYKDLVRIFQISDRRAWWDIYIPSAITAFVTGSITAVGAAWNSLIVAEYFTTGNSTTPLTQVGFGIGKTITIATNQGDLVTLSLAIITMTVLIVGFNLVVWRRIYHYTTSKYTYNR
jgi:NitT/TauT family transport system permease protein